MIETFEGRQYRKISGRRYDYWKNHLPEENDLGQFICEIEVFGRLMALTLVDESGQWLIPVSAVEEKVNEIVDDWPADEVISVGGHHLVDFNNLGLKVQETVEKN